MLDGDNLAHGLNLDLRMTVADRAENIRRVGEAAKLMADAGLMILCSHVSRFRAERRVVRELLENDKFLEIFLDTPHEECRRRDPKGFHGKADARLMSNFTGVSSPNEPPDFHLRSEGRSAAGLAADVIAAMRAAGRLG